ncbi:hypothetical protein QFZ54_002974 [Sphingomonas faeni]|nr:hypothetical protein [Sphingomonas faeni]
MMKTNRKTHAVTTVHTPRPSNRRRIRRMRWRAAPQANPERFYDVLRGMVPGETLRFGKTVVSASEAASGCVYKLTRA